MYQLLGHIKDGSIKKVENDIYVLPKGFTANMVVVDIDTGDVSRVVENGSHLQLWHLGHGAASVKRLVATGDQDGFTQVAQEFDEQLEELRAQDATYAQASGRWGWQL